MGKSLLHLHCHFGLDTLSFTRLGAEVTGVDFSEPAIEAARDLFETIDYPALMHCKSGADRAGLMSAFYMIFRQGQPVKKALEQLSGKYLHVKSGKTGMLDAFFEAYLKDTAESGKSFMDWVREDYDRMAVKTDFLERRKGRLSWDRLLRRE